ncbi:uncharacterized protein LOC129802424 isoform X2 [Phlebotomus papatasi]|uniref:uncharacterized protein LOC129802424 isoform X2 n=1 Tax=Phlebotomus papatasi TaxID=29031 RepID=UPI00248343EE|nr:uncharacterized protein LOC129802424 isoform X2 [Phlebotomus papatasi]
MWSCRVVFLHVLLVLSYTLWAEGNDNLERNFLDNLEETFSKKWNASSEKIESEIDEIIHEFVNLKNQRKRFRRDTQWRGSDHLKLVGFEEMGSIPVSFPLDFCLINVFGATFAVALHSKGPKFENATNSTDISFLQLIGTDFEIVYQKELPKSHSMDCISMGDQAFVAVVGEFRKNTKDLGSPIFQIQQSGVRIVHLNRMEHQLVAKFWSHGNDIFLMETCKTSHMPIEIQQKFLCPIYKWTIGGNFEIWNELPCSNAVAVEVFEVNGDIFLGLANGIGEKRLPIVPSVIYRFDENSHKFAYHQSIVTDGVVDLKYFHANEEDYLIIANSPGQDNPENDNFVGSYSIIYKFTHGHFLPIQSIATASVTGVLPVTVLNDHVILLFSGRTESMKIFEYDGWKFQESTLKYTTESFEIGVSRMREYSFGEQSVIVIANKRVFGEIQNVFMPQFKTVPNYDVHGAMLEWCEESIAEMSSINFEGFLAAMTNLPKATDEVLEFSNGLEFSSLNVENLLAQEIKTPLVTLNEDTAKEINTTSISIVALNEKMNIINTTLRNFLSANSGILTQEPLQQNSSQELSSEKYDFDELTVEEIQTEFINGLPFESLIRTDTPLNLSGIELECRNVSILGELTVKNFLDGVKLDKNHILLKNSDPQHLNFTALDTLIVNDVHLQRINSLDFSLILNGLKEMKSVEKNVTVLKADNLFVNGSVNGVDLAVLEKYALRTEGNQIIIEVSEIDHLVADKVNAFRKVSEKNISNAVLASNGDFLLDYPVSFYTNISVEKLQVTERLNQIEVFDGKLDIILLNSTEMQIVDGKKTFDNVSLLKPILLQGKINSQSLDKMNPMASINDNLVLDGDYFITGPVTVNRVLRVEDLVSGNLSLQKLFSDGLKIDTMEVHQNINFQQPIKIFDFYTESINGLDPENFVKINTEEIQTITGKKYFKSDLMINDGFCDAEIIQGVNLTELNLNILHRDGNETIDGDIHFRKITVNSVKGENVRFSGQNFSNFLHFDRDQFISGRVTINKTFSVQDNLTIGDLYGNGTVGKVPIEDFVVNSARKGQRIILTGKKIFKGGLTIGSMDVNHFPGFNVSQIDGQFFGFLGEKIIWGSIEFPNEMSIKNFDFRGTLNNIAASDFGICWLLTEGDQEFTANQIFSKVQVQDGAVLEGSLNEKDFEELYKNSYFINQQETLPVVEFLDEVTVNDALLTNGSLAGVLLPQLLMKKSKASYKISKLDVYGDLFVDKNLMILEYVNNINLPTLSKFLVPSSTSSLDNLVVHGSATFNMEPKVIFINGWNIAYVLQNALMIYNQIHFTEFVQFSWASFRGNIDLVGTINGINLTYVATNYMSLTKPQTISTKIAFLNNVELKTVLSSSQLHIDGYLKSISSGEAIKIEELNEKAAKISGNQSISGQWVVENIFVEGDLKNVKINGLDMQEDIVRYDVDFNNVTGLKKCHYLVVEDLQCEDTCIIQDVDVKKWFAQAVFLIGNHTIHGKITLKNSIFLTDIKVNGLVNNITFNHDTILTKNLEQTIEGNIYIDNRSRDKTKLHSLNFHKLQAETINGRNIEEFLENVATQNDYKSGENLVETPVIFEKSLVAEHLQCQGQLFGVNISEMDTELEMAQTLSFMENKLKRLYEKAQAIIKHRKGNAFYVIHYTVAQTFPGVLKKIVPIELMRHEKKNLYLAILAGSSNETIIDFYRLEEFKRRSFVESDILPIRFEDGELTSIDRLHLLGQDYLFTEKYSEDIGYKQTIFHYAKDKIKVIYERFTDTPKRMTSVKLNSKNSKQDCIVQYSVKDFQVTVECLMVNESGNVTWKPYQNLIIPDAREIMPLKINSFAVITTNGSVILLENHPKEKWQEKQTLTVINPLDMSSETFEDKLFLGICSGQTKNSVHHGSVEIFRLIGKEFVHFQNIRIESPVRLQFSILPTGEFVLYVLTSNPAQPLIVYKYSGISGFRQFAIALTIPRGNRLSVIKIPKFSKEFVAVLSPNEATLLEAIMR